MTHKQSYLQTSVEFELRDTNCNTYYSIDQKFSNSAVGHMNLSVKLLKIQIRTTFRLKLLALQINLKWIDIDIADKYLLIATFTRNCHKNLFYYSVKKRFQKNISIWPNIKLITIQARNARNLISNYLTSIMKNAYYTIKHANIQHFPDFSSTENGGKLTILTYLGFTNLLNSWPSFVRIVYSFSQKKSSSRFNVVLVGKACGWKFLNL